MKQLTEQMQQANLSEKEQAVMEKILSNISNTVFLSGAQRHGPPPLFFIHYYLFF